MLVIKNKDAEGKEKQAPHLALTHEAQGGPANGRTASLLLKSAENLSSEDKALLESFFKSNEAPKGQIEKSSYQSLYRKLDRAVVDKVKEKDRYEWAYVRDFSDDKVIYSAGGGVFAIGYTVDASGEVELSGDAITVNEILTWESEEGKIVVTQSDTISTDVVQLVTKSFATPKGDLEALTAIFKTQSEGKLMNELETQNKTLTDELASVKAELEKAQAVIKAAQEQAEIAKAAKRLEIVKSVVAAEKVEALHKSLATLGDTEFDSVIETLSIAKSAVEGEKTDLFKTVSDGSAPATPDLEVSEVDSLAAVVKARTATAK